ncbi:hypothetical protein F2Q70_00026795 [Brassica cretica]|nr:hypothetical protein F2Q70_00026795 [Brassica cretica]
MEGFITCEAPAGRRKSRTRKDKHIAVDDDEADGGCFPEDAIEDYFNSGELIDFSELLGSDVPPADGGTEKEPEFIKASRMGLLVMNRALDASSQEARMAQFRVEVEDKEFARLRYEFPSLRARIDCEGNSLLGEFKEIYQGLGDYRECRGTMGGLYLTQIPDYSFAAEDAKQTWRMKERDMDFALSQIEERIWKKWEPIPVSPDTVESETGAPDEAGEVNQTSVPLNVNDYSIGGSMTGYYEFDG